MLYITENNISSNKGSSKVLMPLQSFRMVPAEARRKQGAVVHHG